MTYEDFFTPHEVEVYKRVKRGTMRLGRAARRCAARLVRGAIQGTGHEYVVTDLGTYCLVMASNSLNTTERWAIEQEVDSIVVMGDDEEMGAWFKEHGVRNGLARFKHEVRREVNG